MLSLCHLIFSYIKAILIDLAHVHHHIEGVEAERKNAKSHQSRAIFGVGQKTRRQDLGVADQESVADQRTLEEFVEVVPESTGVIDYITALQ